MKYLCKEDRIIYRVIALDLLRFAAIVGMIIFHILYDLANFYHLPIPYDSGWLNIYRLIAIAGAFIFAGGWSSTLQNDNLPAILRLGLAAVLVSAVTYLLFGTQWIRFGILHLLFSCKLLHYMLRIRSLRFCLLISSASFLAALYTPTIIISHNYWAALNITATDFQTLDHYPLLPWLGVFYLGVAFGQSRYAPTPTAINDCNPYLCRLLTVSRHSLLIYLLHQPLILAVLYLCPGI